MADVVGASEVAMHSVERGRLWRAQMRAAIFDLVPIERENAAVMGNGCGQRNRAVGCGNRSRKMFEPILDPFHRASACARGSRDQDDVGEYTLFDAKASAGIRWRAQAQAIAGNLQGARQYRVNTERTLEIGENIVSVFAGIIVGHDP